MPREYSGCKFGDNLAVVATSADRRYSIPLGRRDRGKKTTESASIFAIPVGRVEERNSFVLIDVTVDIYGYGLRILFRGIRDRVYRETNVTRSRVNVNFRKKHSSVSLYIAYIKMHRNER